MRSADHVSCDLNGEVAILNLKSTLYFGLNQVGGIVWDALSEPKTVADICRAVLDRFDVDEARCHKDVLELLSKLDEAGLIETVRPSPG